MQNTQVQNCLDAPGQVAQLYSENHSFVWSTINKLINNQNDVDDVAQDFFVSLLQRPIPSDMKDCKPYLYRILHRDVIDYSRSNQRYQKMMSKFCEYSQYQSKKTISSKSGLTENYPLIMNLIQKTLPPRQATALMLRYKYDYKYEKIAQIMNVNPQSSRKYVCFALKKIRKELQRKGVL
jgi:RNA polymerase sigma factor (sigma-70 family)